MPGVKFTLRTSTGCQWMPLRVSTISIDSSGMTPSRLATNTARSTSRSRAAIEARVGGRGM